MWYSCDIMCSSAQDCKKKIQKPQFPHLIYHYLHTVWRGGVKQTGIVKLPLRHFSANLPTKPEHSHHLAVLSRRHCCGRIHTFWLDLWFKAVKEKNVYIPCMVPRGWLLLSLIILWDIPTSKGWKDTLCPVSPCTFSLMPPAGSFGDLMTQWITFVIP